LFWVTFGSVTFVFIVAVSIPAGATAELVAKTTLPMMKTMHTTNIPATTTEATPTERTFFSLSIKILLCLYKAFLTIIIHLAEIVNTAADFCRKKGIIGSL
jgi:hypothetical protein